MIITIMLIYSVIIIISAFLSKYRMMLYPFVVFCAKSLSLSLYYSFSATGSETVHMWGAKWQTHKNNDAFHTKPKECIKIFDISLLRGLPHIRIFLSTGKTKCKKCHGCKNFVFHLLLLSIRNCIVQFSILHPIIHPNFLYPSYRPWKIRSHLRTERHRGRER